MENTEFDLNWAKRGGVVMLKKYLAKVTYVCNISGSMHVAQTLGQKVFNGESFASVSPRLLRMATPDECRIAWIEYIERPVSDQSLSDLQQRAQAALRYAEKLRGIFHVSMLKAYPQKTHQEISDEIDNAMKEVK